MNGDVGCDKSSLSSSEIISGTRSTSTQSLSLSLEFSRRPDILVAVEQTCGTRYGEF